MECQAESLVREILHQVQQNRSTSGWFFAFFQTTNAPNHKRIYAWVKKFDDYGTVENLNKKCETRESHSGRKRIRNEALIERVRKAVADSPKRSTRKRCQSLDIHRTTLRRILRDDLGKFSYHIQTMHKLTKNDKERREAMADVLMEKIEVNKSFLPYLMTSDEAHFTLDGQVNSKNNIYWGESPPVEVNQRPLHSPKVTAWCALWSKGIFGPYFFEENNATVTVNKERYLVVLNDFYNDLERLYSPYLVPT